MTHANQRLGVIAAGITLFTSVLVFGTTPTAVSPMPWQQFLLPQILSTAPTEPHACEAGKEGSSVYVNDTDDILGGDVCMCENTAAGGFDWMSVGQVSTVTGLPLPCPFF